MYLTQEQSQQWQTNNPARPLLPQTPNYNIWQDSLNNVMTVVKQNGENMSTRRYNRNQRCYQINEAEGVNEQFYSTQGKVSRLELKNCILQY